MINIESVLIHYFDAITLYLHFVTEQEIYFIVLLIIEIFLVTQKSRKEQNRLHLTTAANIQEELCPIYFCHCFEAVPVMCIQKLCVSPAMNVMVYQHAKVI